MGLQAIIFDVDGTMAETADLHRAAFNHAFKAHGVRWHWDREIFNQLILAEFTLPKLQLFAAAAQQTGKTPVPPSAALASIARLKAKVFCQMVRGGAAHLRPGVARLMKEIKHEGLIMGAVSTSSRVETQTLLAATLGHYGMGWISCLKTADNAVAGAGERSLYQAVLDDFGIEGRSAIAIEDSPSGASAAEACGLSVLITPSMYTARYRFENANLVLSDLGQPAAPFTVMYGESGGRLCVSPALLHEVSHPKAAAA